MTAVEADPPGRHADPVYRVAEQTYKLEPKVKAAVGAGVGAAAAVGPFVLWLTDQVAFGGGEFDVPLQVVGFVEFIVVGVCALVAGYFAPHVERITGRSA